MENIEKMKTTPKDFFIHLGVLVSLYISVISILTLVFSIIDQVFPKEFSYTDPYAGGVSLAMAMLIVSFPLCVLFTRALSKEEIALPEKRNLWARKALTYCTLFLAILVVAIDLIVLLQSFFSGEEITVSFALKVLFIIMVIGTVAGYYLYDLRRALVDDGAVVRTRYTYASLAFIVVAFGFGFFVMGTPYAQKQKRFDESRVQDLSNIQSEIISYWQRKKKLPLILADLNDSLNGVVVPVDPVTESPYEYVVKGKLAFQLCATFSKANLVGVNMPGYRASMMYPYKNSINDNWQHAEGRVCYDRTIDPELYLPVLPTAVPVPAPVR
ncbi:MAG: DUF5671 domain-containing protein [Minisyncoccia bacterium]